MSVTSLLNCRISTSALIAIQNWRVASLNSTLVGLHSHNNNNLIEIISKTNNFSVVSNNKISSLFSSNRYCSDDLAWRLCDRVIRLEIRIIYRQQTASIRQWIQCVTSDSWRDLHAFRLCAFRFKLFLIFFFHSDSAATKQRRCVRMGRTLWMMERERVWT